MQIGMHPGSRAPLVFLCGFVRLVPISLRIPPEAGESAIEFRGWRVLGKEIAEMVRKSFQKTSIARVPVPAR